tara:strand:- start:1012 stop:1239 length:228 start_codon:yes stop_codon:yes gene_type:complete
MHQENGLFGFDEFHTKDENPVDKTQITTTLLYYSQDELKELKALGKTLLKKHYPENYMESNLSDLILKLFRDENS